MKGRLLAESTYIAFGRLERAVRHEVRRQITKGREYEPALPHPRMRHLEIGLVDGEVADEEDVDIECARTPAFEPHAVGVRLELVTELEQLSR